MKNANGMPFGYETAGEKIDHLQKELIRNVFDIVNRYCGDIADKDLELIIKEHKKVYGEELSIEQARENITVDITKGVMNKELNRKWQEYLSAKRG